MPRRTTLRGSRSRRTAAGLLVGLLVCSLPVLARTATATVGSYAAEVGADGPVAWWRLGEAAGSGVAGDASGHGRSGVYAGGVALGTPGALVADGDTAATFDGSTGKVTVPDAASLRLNGAFTIEFWARSPRFVNSYPGLLVKGAASSGDGFLVFQSSTGALVLKRNNTTVGTPAGVLLASRYRHFAVTYDGAFVRWYVDGALVSSAGRTFPASVGTAPVLLGQGDQPGNTALDEVAFYAGALSAGRVAAHASAGTTPAPSASPSPSASASPSASPSPSAAPSDPVIVAVGDIACDPTDANFNGGLGTSDYCRMGATARLVGTGNAAVLPLGDEQYSDGTLAKFQQSYGPSWGKVTDPVHPVPGNHEYTDGTATGYYTYFGGAAGPQGKGWYSYDIGRWHLIALNSECAYTGGCGVGSPEEQWLKNDLATHPAPCTLAYWHEPRYGSGEYGENGISFGAFWDDLYAAGADVVLNGHVHNYERFAPMTPAGVRDDARGLREFIVGTGGKNFFGFPSVLPNSEVHNGSTYGVLRLTLSANSYTWTFSPVPGQTFSDTGTSSCH